MCPRRTEALRAAIYLINKSHIKWPSRSRSNLAFRVY